MVIGREPTEEKIGFEEEIERKEAEKGKAITYIELIRHAPRLAGKNVFRDEYGNLRTIEDPTGLSERGKKIAQEYGKKLSDMDLVKAYGSLEPRTIETGEIITATSEVISQQTGKPAIPRKRPGIDYKSVLDPEVLKKAKEVIQEHLPPNFAQLSQEERAVVREELQHLGLKVVLENEEAVDRMAQGMANQLETMVKVARRGVKIDSKVAMCLVGHSAFIESLFKKALVREKEGKRKIGFDDVDEIGGFIKPGESFRIKIVRDKEGKEEIDFKFSNPERLKGEKYWLDMDTIKELADKYKERVEREKKEE